MDATDAFNEIHTKDMIAMFHDERVGVLEDQGAQGWGGDEVNTLTVSDLRKHSVVDDCWVSFYGYAYDMTDFIQDHPGGPGVIEEVCGSDGTDAFRKTKHHTESFLNLVRDKHTGRVERE